MLYMLQSSGKKLQIQIHNVYEQLHSPNYRMSVWVDVL